MPQFAPRRTQPLRPDSYRRIARLARRFADRLDATAEAATPTERASRTKALDALLRVVQDAWQRNAGLSDG